jgi:hypothetical protein
MIYLPGRHQAEQKFVEVLALSDASDEVEGGGSRRGVKEVRFLALKNLASLYQEDGRTADAVEASIKALAEDGDDVNLWTSLGYRADLSAPRLASPNRLSTQAQSTLCGRFGCPSSFISSNLIVI